MSVDRSSLSSKRGNLRGLIRLARPLNLLYAAGTLALLRFGWMARWGTDGEFTSLPWPLFLEGMGVVVLLMAAGNWINAYFDVVEDRINRPDRAIVDRTVKRRVLILAHPTFNLIALGLAGHLSLALGSWTPLLMALGVAFLLWMYSARWKAIPLVGNGVVAGLIGLVPLWLGVLESPFHPVGSSSEQTLWLGMLAYGGMASGIAMVREIAKDAQDIEGDLAAGKTTFPARFGTRTTRWTCLALLLLIGLAYGTALSTMDLETGPVSRLKWSIPAVGWSWSLMLLMGSETRWDRVSTATLLTLLLGSLQCLWIDGF